MSDATPALFVLPSAWDSLSHAEKEDWAYSASNERGDYLSHGEQRWRIGVFAQYLQTAEGQAGAEADGYASPADDFEREVEREIRRLRIRETALVRFAEETASEFATEWAGVLGSEFDPNTPEPVPCVLEVESGKFAFAPGIVFAFGARSALKTWLAYEAVVQEVRRGNAALLLDYELSYEEAMRRLYTLGMLPAEAERVVYVHPSAGISDAARARLRDRFGDAPPSVVVIDSMGMAMGAVGLDTNKDADVSKWAFDVPLWLKAEWPESVILIIDHTTKASGGESSDPIGSQRKSAIADLTVNVHVQSPISRTKRGTGRATVRKDRKGFYEPGADIFDYEFGGGGAFVMRPADPNLISVEFGEEGIARTKIAAYVNSHPGDTVEKVRGALGIQTVSFTSHKDALVAEGVIIHLPRKGLYPGPRWQEWMSSQIVTDD